MLTEPDFRESPRDEFDVPSFALYSECWLAVNLFLFQAEGSKKAEKAGSLSDLSPLAGVWKDSLACLLWKEVVDSFSLWFLTLHTGFIITDKQSLLSPQLIITIRLHLLPLITVLLAAYKYYSFLISEVFISEGFRVTWIFNYINLIHFPLVICLLLWPLTLWWWRKWYHIFSLLQLKQWQTFPSQRATVPD